MPYLYKVQVSEQGNVRKGAVSALKSSTKTNENKINSMGYSFLCN